tara:strand:+ start:265 stop:516 length:252 start_codon:yes stop_codon:yes gene_type:complete
MVKVGTNKKHNIKDLSEAIVQITDAMSKIAKVLDLINNRLITVEKEQKNPTRNIELFKSNVESTINMLSKSELSEIGLIKKDS